MIYEFNNSIPVTTPMGDGYILYVKENGMWENDIFTVVLENGGSVKHFTSEQIKVWKNATFNINSDK